MPCTHNMVPIAVICMLFMSFDNYSSFLSAKEKCFMKEIEWNSLLFFRNLISACYAGYIILFSPQRDCSHHRIGLSCSLSPSIQSYNFSLTTTNNYIFVMKTGDLSETRHFVVLKEFSMHRCMCSMCYMLFMFIVLQCHGGRMALNSLVHLLSNNHILGLFGHLVSAPAKVVIRVKLTWPRYIHSKVTVDLTQKVGHWVFGLSPLAIKFGDNLFLSFDSLFLSFFVLYSPLWWLYFVSLRNVLYLPSSVNPFLYFAHFQNFVHNSKLFQNC
jgi:hypothetical protein